MTDSEQTTWTISMIKQLEKAGIGDVNRLTILRLELEEGQSILPNEVRYLKELFQEFQQRQSQGIQNQTIPNTQNADNTIPTPSKQNKTDQIQWTMEMIEKFQQAQLGDESLLQSIKDDLIAGNEIDQKRTDFIHDVFEKFQQYVTARKLKYQEIGDFTKLDKIITDLKNGRTLTFLQSDYLENMSKILQKPGEHSISNYNLSNLVGKMKIAKIGDPKKLEEISKRLVNDHLTDEEHDYLMQKAYLMIKTGILSTH